MGTIMDTNLTTEYKAELQRMIDKGAVHMRAQGKVCVGVLGSCEYRADDGSKCFIGSLIEDEHYTADIEGNTIATKPTHEGASVVEALERSGYTLDGIIEPLNTAQWRLHDLLEHDSDFPAAFEAALISYCSDYGLNYTTPAVAT